VVLLAAVKRHWNTLRTEENVLSEFPGSAVDCLGVPFGGEVLSGIESSCCDAARVAA
jgi:hypothetical protein